MLATGFPWADAENDFLRARRHQFLAAAGADSGAPAPRAAPNRSYWASICRAITQPHAKTGSQNRTPALPESDNTDLCGPA